MSLKLDLELALTGYDQSKTNLVMQELEELCRDLQKRIDLAKQAQGETMHKPRGLQQNYGRQQPNGQPRPSPH